MDVLNELMTMPVDPRETTYFKQARFSTRLPNTYLYLPSHYWLQEIQPGVLRIGMTKFATRMLGDFVEFRFDVGPGNQVAVGEPIGCIEGFKAMADVYCAVDGEFVAANSQIERQPELIDADPYDQGWLYQVKGRPGNDALDVAGYVNVLNATIQKMMAAAPDAPEEKTC